MCRCVRERRLRRPRDCRRCSAGARCFAPPPPPAIALFLPPGSTRRVWLRQAVSACFGEGPLLWRLFLPLCAPVCFFCLFVLAPFSDHHHYPPCSNSVSKTLTSFSLLRMRRCCFRPPPAPSPSTPIQRCKVWPSRLLPIAFTLTCASAAAVVSASLIFFFALLVRHLYPPLKCAYVLHVCVYVLCVLVLFANNKSHPLHARRASEHAFTHVRFGVLRLLSPFFAVRFTVYCTYIYVLFIIIIYIHLYVFIYIYIYILVLLIVLSSERNAVHQRAASDIYRDRTQVREARKNIPTRASPGSTKLCFQVG